MAGERAIRWLKESLTLVLDRGLLASLLNRFRIGELPIPLDPTDPMPRRGLLLGLVFTSLSPPLTLDCPRVCRVEQGVHTGAAGPHAPAAGGRLTN